MRRRGSFTLFSKSKARACSVALRELAFCLPFQSQCPGTTHLTTRSSPQSRSKCPRLRFSNRVRRMIVIDSGPRLCMAHLTSNFGEVASAASLHKCISNPFPCVPFLFIYKASLFIAPTTSVNVLSDATRSPHLPIGRSAKLERSWGMMCYVPALFKASQQKS